MNATVWTLCFPRAVELWCDRCTVRNFCPCFYQQLTLRRLRMSQEQCNLHMSHLVPLVRQKRSALTLCWPKGKGLVLRGSPRSFPLWARVQSFFSHQVRVRTITPTHCPVQPTPLHDPFVMMNEEWLSRQTLEQQCYQAAVDTLCQPRAMHLWQQRCLIMNLCPVHYDALTFRDMRLAPENCTVRVTRNDTRAALICFRARTHSLHAPRQRRSVKPLHEPPDCSATDTPVSRLHADLAMEAADPLMMAAAARKYQEDCMVLAAQQVCTGRNICGLETCPAHYRQLTADEFQVPPSICANLKSP